MEKVKTEKIIENKEGELSPYNEDVLLEDYLNDPTHERPLLIIQKYTLEQMVDLHRKVCDEMDRLIDSGDHFIDGKAGKPIMIKFFTALKLKLAIQYNIDGTQSEELKKAKRFVAYRIKLNNLKTAY